MIFFNASNLPVLIQGVITWEELLLHHQTWSEIEHMEPLFTQTETGFNAMMSIKGSPVRAKAF